MLIIAFIFSFVLGYTGMHYSLTSWGVASPWNIIAGVVFGLLVAFFATLQVSAIFAL